MTSAPQAKEADAKDVEIARLKQQLDQLGGLVVTLQSNAETLHEELQSLLKDMQSQSGHGATERYGNRNVPKMVRQIDDLRKAIRAEGTPAIQDAWDKVEEHIDFAYARAPLSPAVLAEVPEVRDLVAAETERCARVVEEIGFAIPNRQEIAAAIREART